MGAINGADLRYLWSLLEDGYVLVSDTGANRATADKLRQDGHLVARVNVQSLMDREVVKN